MHLKVISGAQTGVDRAALDVARALGIAHGGSVPRGRIADDGPIPFNYNVVETDSAGYPERTRKNVLDSDGTILITRGPLRGGSELTRAFATEQGKPFRVIDLDTLSEEVAATQIIDWLRSIKCRTVNVAGPRSREIEGIYHASYNLLLRVLVHFASGEPK